MLMNQHVPAYSEVIIKFTMLALRANIVNLMMAYE